MQTFKEMMFPILELLSSEKQYSRQDIYYYIANYFSLSDEQKSITIKSGQALYKNRADWAITYLCSLKDLPENKKLLNRVSRGIYQITPLGLSLCKDKNAFKQWYQEQYKEIIQLENKSKKSSEAEKTPHEQIDNIYKKLLDSLKTSLLEEIKSRDPRFFEDLVLRLLEKMGYGINGNTRLTSKGADEGIDGIISEDELGLSKIYVQAKRWDGNVSRPEIQKFVGAISDKPTQKGVFITTSSFSKDAINYAKNIQNLVIILIDGDELCHLMIKHKVGVYVKQTIEFCEIDRDFFEE